MAKHPIHDLSFVPEKPEQTQWRIVWMPCAFVCCMCREMKPAWRIATAYWTHEHKWWNAACSYHKPVEGFHPGMAFANEFPATRAIDIAVSVDDRGAELAIARKALRIYAQAPIDVSKDNPLIDSLRALWRLVFVYGSTEPPPLFKVLAVRGITHAEKDAFIRKHPAVRVMIATLADLVGLELTGPAKKNVHRALVDLKTIAQEAP